MRTPGKLGLAWKLAMLTAITAGLVYLCTGPEDYRSSVGAVFGVVLFWLVLDEFLARLTAFLKARLAQRLAEIEKRADTEQAASTPGLGMGRDWPVPPTGWMLHEDLGIYPRPDGRDE